MSSTTEIAPPRFSVKSVKTFPSREFGPKGGYTAKILYDGKEVGEIFEEGNGGAPYITWKANRDEWYANLKAEAEVRDMDTSGFDGFGPMKHSCDSYLGELVEQWESAQWFKKAAKKSTLFRVEGQEYLKGVWSKANVPTSETSREWVKSRYPGKKIIFQVDVAGGV